MKKGIEYGKVIFVEGYYRKNGVFVKSHVRKIIKGITVGILAFNDQELLEFTCRSLWKNTKVPLEIIVIDNGKDKDLKKWCEKQLKDDSKDFRYEGYGKNGSITKGFNSIVKYAKYNYVFLSDDDMYFLPGWDILMEEMGSIGNWRAPMVIERLVAYSDRAIIRNYGDSPANFKEQKLIDDFGDHVWPHRRSASFLPALLRKDDFKKFGGFNEKFKVGEADFTWRAFNYYKSLGKEMLTHPKSYIYHFKHGGKRNARPSWWSEEAHKMRDYMEKTYGHPWKKYDNLIAHYEITDGNRFSEE